MRFNAEVPFRPWTALKSPPSATYKMAWPLKDPKIPIFLDPERGIFL
jgi:hypothetical protein